jgi:hypothetical protein
VTEPNADLMRFDDVARTYAEDLEEIETARARFEACCTNVIDTLTSVLHERVKEAGMAVESVASKASSVGPYGNVFVVREFAERVRKAQSSGISVALAHGEFWGDKERIPFGLYGYMSFAAPRPTAVLQPVRAGLREICPWAAEVRGGYGCIYLVGPPLRPGEGFLPLDEATTMLDEMVEAFPMADEQMARMFLGE